MQFDANSLDELETRARKAPPYWSYDEPVAEYVIELIDELRKTQKERDYLAGQLQYLSKFLVNIATEFKKLENLHLDDINWVELAKVVVDD